MGSDFASFYEHAACWSGRPSTRLTGWCFSKPSFSEIPSSRVIAAALPVWSSMDETGILTPPGDVNAFARSVGSLIRDAIARRRMGEQARDFVVGERNLAQAATRLRAALLPLVEAKGA